MVRQCHSYWSFFFSRLLAQRIFLFRIDTSGSTLTLYPNWHDRLRFFLSQLHSDCACWEMEKRRSCNNNRGTFRRFYAEGAISACSANLTFHGPRFLRHHRRFPRCFGPVSAVQLIRSAFLFLSTYVATRDLFSGMRCFTSRNGLDGLQGWQGKSSPFCSSRRLSEGLVSSSSFRCCIIEDPLCTIFAFYLDRQSKFTWPFINYISGPIFYR
jgi:hypothetical protein